MWDWLSGIMPSGMALGCAVLSFAIPYTIASIHRKMVHYGDPAWKKEKDGPGAKKEPSGGGTGSG